MGATDACAARGGSGKHSVAAHPRERRRPLNSGFANARIGPLGWRLECLGHDAASQLADRLAVPYRRTEHRLLNRRYARRDLVDFLRPVLQLRHGALALACRCHGTAPDLSVAAGPRLRKFGIARSGVPRGGAPAGFSAAAVKSHRGGHDGGGWWKAAWPLLDRSCEAFIVLRDPAHQVLGYSALRLFRETAHLLCARQPMHRIITRHDVEPCFPSAEHVGESRRIWFGRGASVCCEYLYFPSRKSTLRESAPAAGLLIEPRDQFWRRATSRRSGSVTR